MGGLVPVREFTSPEEMREHYAAIRQRCFSPPSRKPATPPMLALPPPTPKRIWAAPSIVPRERVAPPPTALLECVRISAIVGRTTMREIMGPRRKASLTKARQICCWLCKHYGGASLPQIGKQIGGRDHTTALHANRRVQAVIDLGLVVVTDDPVTVAKALWDLEWPAASLVKAPNARTRIIKRLSNSQFTAKGQPSC